MSLNHGLEHDSYKRDRRASRVIGVVGLLLLAVGITGLLGSGLSLSALMKALLFLAPPAILVTVLDYLSG